MTRIGLALSPLDTLFFRDGRPFNAADQASGGLPKPLSLAGALRTAILGGEPGFDFAAFAAQLQSQPADVAGALTAGKLTSEWYRSLRFRGPFLAIQDSADSTPIPLIPVPQNLRRRPDKSTGIGKWSRAVPHGDVPGWNNIAAAGHDNLQPLWLVDADDDDEYPDGFLTLPAIRHYLNNDIDAISDQDWFQLDDVRTTDFRTGIGVNPETLTAADSQIYGISLLALSTKIHRKWCGPDPVATATLSARHHGASVILYAEVLADGVEADVLGERVRGPIPLGGEGHYVNCQPLPESKLVSWPPLPAVDRKFWLLMTPAMLPQQLTPPCWLPNGLMADHVRAAATAHPMAVSGWNSLRNAPRLTRFAIPAGSVFYTEGLSELTNDSICSDLRDVDDDVRQGWGFALAGVWK